MTESTLSGTVVSGHNLRKGRAVDDDNWAPYVVVALLERNDYDTLLAKQQLDPHSFLYNYQRVYPHRRNTYRTDPPKEETESEIKWKEQDFTFPVSTKTEQEILVELWNARPAAPKDELLGEARIGLRSLFVTNGGADGGNKWLTLKKRPVGGSDGGTPGGQILFKFTLNAPKLTYDVDLAMLFPGFQCSVINISDYISDEALEKMGQDKRKRQKVLFEIINTEKTYVRDLYMLNQLFVVRLKEKEILTREEISSIFANIPTLQDMHLELFKTLEALLEKDRSRTEEEIIGNGVMNDGLGDIFLSRANLFKHYAAFCSNHINIGVKIKALQSQKPAFAEFLDECFKMPESRGLPIDSFLITPLQRMVKYPLLLDTLIKATNEDHHDHGTIKQALLEIKSVVDQVNKRTRQEARVKRMLDLQNQILHGDTFNFLDRNRHVVKEGLAKVAGKETYLILFNDVLAFTRKKKDKFDVKAVIQLKGKKWAFLTVVPSFKSAGSTIRKKDMNDPVLVMIPEEDFVDSFPTITVSASMDAIPSPDSARGMGHDPGYLPSSPRGAPSPSSSSSSSSSPSSSSSSSSPPSGGGSSSPSSLGAVPSPSSSTPSPPSYTKASSCTSLPQATSTPLTPPQVGHNSASLPQVPSTKNLPEISSNSNQFAEGGIYKFFFKTVEERNEWMTKFRKVAGMLTSPATNTTSSPAPLTPTSASSSSAGDLSPKKSLTEIVKQKHDSRRNSRTRSVSASLALVKPDGSATTTGGGGSPPPSTAGSPSGSPSPLTRSNEPAKSPSSGESAAVPSPSSSSGDMAALAEREASLQQAVSERNAEIAELKKRLEHEEALRKEVQLTCQTLQKKIVESEKDKAEKIKAEKESSEFVRTDVLKKLHQIERELAEEREERRREREGRRKLEDKVDKMWDSLLDAIHSTAASNSAAAKSDSKGAGIVKSPAGGRALGSSIGRSDGVSWKVDKKNDNDGEEDVDNNGTDGDVGAKNNVESEGGSAIAPENDVLSPRTRRRKEEKKKEKEREKEKKATAAVARAKSADTTESEGSDMSGSGSEIVTSAGGSGSGSGGRKGSRGSGSGVASPSAARSRASTSGADKKNQWRLSIWWGNKGNNAAAAAANVGNNSAASNKSPPVGKATLAEHMRRDSEADSEGSERDDSRDIKRKQMEKTSSWRSKKNTASLPRTLSHGSMEKEKLEVKKDKQKEAKTKEKETKEESKKKKQTKESKKEKKESKKKSSGGKRAPVDTVDNNTNGNGEDQPRMHRSNSLPSATSPRPEASSSGLEPGLGSDEEQEEWEMDSASTKKKNKNKNKKNKKQQKDDSDDDDDEVEKKKEEEEESSSEEEKEDEEEEKGEGEEENGDDLLVGSPRSNLKRGASTGSMRSLSRSADTVATHKITKQKA